MVFAQHGKDYSFRWPPYNDKKAYVGCKRDGNDFFGPGSRCDGDVLINGEPARSGEDIPIDWHVVHMVKAPGREVSSAQAPAARSPATAPLTPRLVLPSLSSSPLVLASRPPSRP